MMRTMFPIATGPTLRDRWGRTALSIVFAIALALTGARTVSADVCDDGRGIGGTGFSGQDDGRGLGGTGRAATDEERGLGGTGHGPDDDDDRGIGGTGFIGPITGFGSICVNGERIRFDEDRGDLQ